MSIDDHEKISALLDKHAMPASPERQLLEWKLNEAIQLKRAYLFADVVSAESQVNFLSLRDGLEYWVKIDYPDEKKEEGTVSLFSPIGAALIGLSKGQEFHWCGQSGRRSGVKVIEVLQTPRRF
jgi:regulator of nucleoside diphosphate kinase